VNTKPVEPKPGAPDGLADAVRTQRKRQRWSKEGEPSVVRFVGQIGVLGWIIVAPTLIGLFMVFPSELFNHTYESNHERIDAVLIRVVPGRRAVEKCRFLVNNNCPPPPVFHKC